jgi:hypothetical protein
MRASAACRRAAIAGSGTSIIGSSALSRNAMNP